MLADDDKDEESAPAGLARPSGRRGSGLDNNGSDDNANQTPGPPSFRRRGNIYQQEAQSPRPPDTEVSAAVLQARAIMARQDIEKEYCTNTMYQAAINNWLSPAKYQYHAPTEQVTGRTCRSSTLLTTTKPISARALLWSWLPAGLGWSPSPLATSVPKRRLVPWALWYVHKILNVYAPTAPGGADKKTAFQNNAIARTISLCCFQGEKPVASLHRQNFPTFEDPAFPGEQRLQIPDSMIALAATIICSRLKDLAHNQTTPSPFSAANFPATNTLPISPTSRGSPPPLSREEGS